MHIMLPVGHAHNTGGTLPGMAHFLEHMAANHSARYPGHGDFSEWIGLQGGYNNAYTDTFHTVYIAEISTAGIREAWEGLVAQTFQPLFREENISLQRTIVASERKRRERWYPGHDELGQYARCSWQKCSPNDLFQMYGSDSDLARVRPENLQDFHAHYFDTRNVVLTAGRIDVNAISAPLAQLELTRREIPEKYSMPEWHNKEYHEMGFRDVTQPILYVGGLFPFTPDQQTKAAIEFIGNLLTNSDHGPLYKWLRLEKGWVYGLSFKSEAERYLRWRMKFPVHELSQVGTIRAELWERIERAVNNEALLEREVGRRIGAQAFHFQTLESVISGAEYDLQLYGTITSEAVYRSLIERCRDTRYLQDIAEKYMSPDVWGEFCALPADI